MRRPPPLALLVLLPLLGLSAVARGDDWPQFRKDAGRTAASKDKLKLPLAEIWSYSSGDATGRSCLHNAALWRGRAYFTPREGNARYLVCADAKTGSVYWSRPLTSPRLTWPVTEHAGPAVTQAGVVFVYDEVVSPQIVGWGIANPHATGIPAPGLDPGENVFLPLPHGTVVSGPAGHYLRLAEVARDYMKTGRVNPRLASLLPAFAVTKDRDTLKFSASIATEKAGRNEKGEVVLRREFGHAWVSIMARRVLCVRTFDALSGQPGPRAELPSLRFLSHSASWACSTRRQRTTKAAPWRWSAQYSSWKVLAPLCWLETSSARLL